LKGIDEDHTFQSHSKICCLKPWETPIYCKGNIRW